MMDFKLPKLVLRVVEIVFALIVLGTTGSFVSGVRGEGGSGYALFVAITTILVNAALIFMAFKGTLPLLVELAVVAVYNIFWLAAASVLSDKRWVCLFAGFSWDPNAMDGEGLNWTDTCPAWQAAEAFAWLSWLSFIASLAMPAIEYYKERNAAGGTAEPYADHTKPDPPAGAPASADNVSRV